MKDPGIDDEFLSTSKKWWYFLSAWGAVALLTLVLTPEYLLAAPWFPVGLLALLPDGGKTAVTAWMTLFPIVLGWGVYCVFSVVLFKIRRAQTFFIVYVLFCILLALNIGGCQKLLDVSSKIH